MFYTNPRKSFQQYIGCTAPFRLSHKLFYEDEQSIVHTAGKERTNSEAARNTTGDK